MIRVLPHMSSDVVAHTIAFNIRSELICCDAYRRWPDDPDTAEERGHGLCYWAEAAARVAENCIDGPDEN